MMLTIPPSFQARVHRDEPMSQHTSWRVGGTADVFFTPRDVEDLVAFLAVLPPDTPILWVGLGSNLLVRAGGVRGVVICTHGALSRLERRSQTRVYCEAGVPCARVARQCVKWGLAAAEFFSGIPGTLGGALAMNAGAFGGETWRHVVTVRTIDRSGAQHERPAAQFDIGYRQVRMPVASEWFLAAQLQFQPAADMADTVDTAGAAAPGAAAAAGGGSIREQAARRKLTQPLGERSCGSVFKNPPGDHAARLIEAAGLKGHRSGDAVVSDKHANFILNQGHASAADLEALIRHVQAEVQRVHGIALEPEVRIVGEAS